MPFAIDDLTSVIAHWSADAIVGLVDGDPVDALPDSISSWDLTGTTTTRPLYRPTGINSLPSIEFDGSDDFLVSASKSLSVTNIGMAIISKVTLKNYGALLFFSTLSGSPGYQAATTRLQSMTWLTLTQCIVGAGDGSSTAYALAQSVLTTNVKSLITGVCGGSIYFIRVNGSAYRRNADYNPPVPCNLSATSVYANLGRTSLAGAFLQGHVSEIVVWDESLGNESFYIEGVLAHKYGITLSTTHPFYTAAPTSGPPTGAGGGLMKIGQGGGYNG